MLQGVRIRRSLGKQIVLGETIDHFRFCQHPIHDKPGRLKIIEVGRLCSAPLCKSGYQSPSPLHSCYPGTCYHYAHASEENRR
jgi:hypothetical protein